MGLGGIFKIFSQSKPSSTQTNQEQKNIEIRKYMDILLESTELLNNSNSLGTVTNRYQMICNAIDNLNIYTDAEFLAAGYEIKSPLTNTKDYMQKNKITIINQAIERNLTYEIESLKTINEKIKKLETIYHTIKSEQFLEPENHSYLEELYAKISKKLADVQLNNISSEVFDLLWFGNGIYKNYTPPSKNDSQIEGTQANSVIIITPHHSRDEPSTIYMDLPISQSRPNTTIESPPYYPSYTGLSSEQRGEYWKFLANPFISQNDIGYVFLYYYGLERHMLSPNLDKAVNMIIKLRSVYNNSSFQFYTANAIILTCLTRNRTDLIKKLMESCEQYNFASIPINYLLLLKYKFNIPLTISEIIKNHQYFGFTNNRYIKNEPELFNSILSEYIMQNFQSNSINLNKYFPMDIDALQIEQKEMFANFSLHNYKASVQIYNNPKLRKKILTLLNDTHKLVKYRLHYESNISLEQIPLTNVHNKQFKKKSFKNMTGHDFEKYCAHLLSLNGFSSISVTKDSGDQGIDIIAYQGDVKYGIQCKLYSNHVGNSAVQEVYSGKDFYKCQIGAVLTNNYFTESAKELASVLGIILWDGTYLQKLQQKE